MTIRINLLISAIVVLGLAYSRAGELACELAQEGDHAGAALEFRRLALAEEASKQGELMWLSAYEYYRAGDIKRSEKLSDLAEEANPDLRVPVLLLRGEAAAMRKDWEESAFYFEGVLAAAGEDEIKRFAARKAAAAKVRARDYEAAEELLARSPAIESEAMTALERYRLGRDRSPAIGGVLGMIPGAGYFYAGEWANGLRSLILNSIFLFGMVHTAQEEQWGAFAVISFFEVTWYSGSIYGGIDASHRYNRRRLDECVAALTGDAVFEPDYHALPALRLTFRF